MDNYQIAQQAFMYAELARIMGMQAENMQRQHRGESMAYGEDQFNVSAHQLENLAIRTMNGI